MQTFRRLNDAERYYGLSWRGWLSAAAAGGTLYGAVRLSPLGIRPTVTITVLILALAGTVLYGLSGQAIGPGRYAIALIGYRLARKQLTCPQKADKHGLVLDTAPPKSTQPEGALVGEADLDDSLDVQAI